MKNHDEHLNDLIGKYLLKEASPVEVAEVEAWLQQSAENRKHFDQLKTILQHANAPGQSFDADAAWNKVKAKIGSGHAEKHEAKVIPINRTRLYLRIAAAVAGVLVVISFLMREPGLKLERATFYADNRVLSDTLKGGTVIHLNKNSTVVAVYNPRKNSYHIELEGEAYFDINKQPQDEFIIQTQGISIRDIGTSFNVQSDSETKQVEIAVEEGEVQMYSDDNPGINIHAGESGAYAVTARTFTKAELTDKNAIAYKTRKFRFNNTPLEQVIESLNAIYDKKIILRGDIGSCNITISFDNEEADAIAELIAETLALQKTETAEGIILEGTGCGK